MVVTQIKEVMITFIENVGYPGIFILMFLDPCFIPLMSEISMPLAGFLSFAGIMNIHIAALIGAAGNTVGALVMHSIGMKVEEARALNFIEKYGKFFLISKKDYLELKGKLAENVNLYAFLGRLLPGARNIISLPAGILKLKRVTFLVATFLGSLSWSYILVILGYKLGQKWQEVESILSEYDKIFYIMLVSIVVIYVYKKLNVK